MTVSRTQTVQLRLFCPVPPPAEHLGQPTEFGMPDKKYVLHPGVALADGTLCFECAVLARRVADDQTVDCSGPFVQGKPGARFLYLGWRAPDGEWIRRWKIPLASLTWAQIEAVAQTGACVLQATIADMNRATVPLAAPGWAVPAP